MKTKILLILMVVNALFCVVTIAQNPDPNWADVKYPNILITECRFSPSNRAYVELTNMEDTAVNLSSFRLVNAYWDSYNNFDPATRYFAKGWRGEIYLTGTLEPGASFVCAYIYAETDSTATSITNNSNSAKMISKITWPVFRSAEFANPAVLTDLNPGLQTYLEDSVFMALVDNPRYFYMFRTAGQNQILLLHDYEYYVTDSVTSLLDTLNSTIAMDVVNVYTADGSLVVPNVPASVAGIANATGSHTMVRKTNGFQTADWINQSRGISSEDSQWWIVPNAPGTEVYSSVGNHGDFSISVSAKANTAALVNNTDKTISVPWEALRGEPVTDNYIDFGDGMAWTFVRDTIDGLDSAYTRVQDGDLLEVYAFGDDLEFDTYTFKVLEPTSDLAIARTKIAKLANGTYANNGYFNITEGVPGMDSILNLQYQLRIDTLLKYIEIPTNATAQIIFVDGDDSRVDLKDGDIFRVTAQNNTSVKDYYVQVNEYAPSRSTDLSAITWPDFDKDYFWYWLDNDTLPGFTPNNKNYTLTLPDYSKNVPALVPHTADLNTVVKVKRATSLTGTLEQRTTTFTVYSEASDTIFDVYSVVFDLDVEKQLTDIEPFFSVLLRGRANFDNYVQIVNPNNGSDELDLSRYLVVVAPNSTDEFTAITNYQSPATPTDPAVHYSYIPGYKFNYDKNDSEDPVDFTWKDGVVGGVTPDANVNPMVIPGDVFVISAYTEGVAYESYRMQDDSTYKFVDVNLSDGNPDFPNLVQGSCVASVDLGSQAIYLYKILNDSIIDGKKGIWTSPADYELVDRMHWTNSDGSGLLAGFGLVAANGGITVRKPRVQKGTLLVDEGMHVDKDTCDLIRFSRNRNAPAEFKLGNAALGDYIGLHLMDPITYHLSTVTSDVYAVDLGISGDDLRIVGEVSTHSVDVFISNLNKPDSMQTITVLKGDVPKDGAALMENGDLVMVYSADSSNMTKYTVQDRALSANTDLEAVADMGIVVDNQNLTVSGFDYTKAIADVLAGVTTVDPLSIINVIDTADNLVTLLTLSKDTSLTERIVATKVFNGIIFEVVAEDGSIAKYTLVPDMSPSDAYITSNVFTVYEETKIISGVAYGYSVSTFLSYLFPSGNATIVLTDKAGHVRTEGLIHFDDVVKVVSEDGSKGARYAINFYPETKSDVTTTQLSDVNNGSSISVYPNPTASRLYIDKAKVGSVLQIISISGNLVHSTIVSNENCSVDMSQLSKGIYFVRLVERDNAVAFKVIKN